MERDFSEYMAACAAAYKDPRRNAVEAALGTLKRTPVEQAIQQYAAKLVKNGQRRGRANAEGRNSHSENVRLVLLKIMRTMGVAYLDELSLGRVSAYLDTSPSSAKTIKGHKSALDGLITYSRQQEWLSSDPLELLDTPELAEGKIEWVKLEDYPTVFEAVAGLPIELPVGLAGLGAARKCEVGRLAPPDWFAQEDRHLRIRPVVSKVNKERFVPITPKLEDLLDRYGQRFGPSLCRSPRKATWQGQNLIRHFRKALKGTGIKTQPDGVPLVQCKQPFNVLRHTCITHWLDAGHDPWKVAKWSGNSVLVIERYYGAHIRRPSDADAADFMRQAK